MHRLFLQSNAVLVVADDARLGIVVRAPDPDARVAAAGLDLAAFRRPHAPTPPGTALLAGLDVDTARALVRAHGGTKSPANPDAVALLARLPARADPETLPTESATPPQELAPGAAADPAEDVSPLLGVGPVPEDDGPDAGDAPGEDPAGAADAEVAPPLTPTRTFPPGYVEEPLQAHVLCRDGREARVVLQDEGLICHIDAPDEDVLRRIGMLPYMAPVTRNRGRLHGHHVPAALVHAWIDAHGGATWIGREASRALAAAEERERDGPIPQSRTYTDRKGARIDACGTIWAPQTWRSVSETRAREVAASSSRDNPAAG